MHAGSASTTYSYRPAHDSTPDSTSSATPTTELAAAATELEWLLEWLPLAPRPHHASAMPVQRMNMYTAEACAAMVADRIHATATRFAARW